MRALLCAVLAAAVLWESGGPARAAVEDLLRAQGFSSAPILHPEGVSARVVPGQDLSRNLDIVEVTINGHRFRLLVNVGVPMITLFRGPAQKAGIPIEPEPAAAKAGLGMGLGDMAQVTSFAIGDVTMPLPRVRVVDFHPSRNDLGDQYDGIFGLLPMRRFKVVFGYDPALFFFKADGPAASGLDAFFAGHGFTGVNPTFVGGHYTVPVELNGAPLTLALSSANLFTVISPAAGERAQITSLRGTGFVVGANGKQAVDQVARYRTFSLGGIPFPPGGVALLDDPIFHMAADPIDGMMGFEPLRRLRPILDTGNDRLYLDHTPEAR